MNLTLFGYPKAGKTTLFNLLAGAHVEVKAYEDGKKDAHVHACPVPDARLDRVAALYPEKTKVQAQVDIVDLAGVSFGEVKSGAYLNLLRKADALVHVVRGFRDASIPHPAGRVAPADDIRIMEEELALADLVSLESRIDRLDKDLKKAKEAEAVKERDLLARLRADLETGRALRELDIPALEEKHLRGFTFLSRKPLIHAVNADETDLADLATPERFAPAPAGRGVRVLAFCGKIEAEILTLEGDDKSAFMSEYGLKEPTSERVFRDLPGWLGEIAFFTVGKDEVRAWMIPEATPALRAAGAVHSDIERGFIRAEVIAWDALLALGSLQAAKDKGAIRLEGKDYAVRDGDVVYFRFAP
ncbi:MAG: redox-regulated ATPase YchF [Candidatus Aminicenantes bacterium]|nr:redox-regulated ATPase YchF [Candidatus Aminicenantes bacterium]